MIKFEDLKRLIVQYVGDPMLRVMPGPEDPEGAGKWVKITRDPGLGLDMENMFDQVAFTVECAGEQGDYDSAEALAFEIDRFFLRQVRQKVGGVLVLYWTRGGGPSVLSIDDSRRWRFVCSYTVCTQSALTV